MWTIAISTETSLFWRNMSLNTKAELLRNMLAAEGNDRADGEEVVAGSETRLMRRGIGEFIAHRVSEHARALRDHRIKVTPE